jgi:succinate dehydrogenase hydrophobic anchor subunit
MSERRKTDMSERRKTDMTGFWYQVGSAVAIAALVIIVIVLVIKNDAVTAAQHRSDLGQCQAANTARTQDIAIWNRILHAPPGAAAAVKAEVADVQRLVAIKDKPRDCAVIYRGG